MRKINHEYTEEIVCPWCGYQFSDSWEFGNGTDDDLGSIECEKCEKEFYASRFIETTYSTERATYGTCAKCKKENIKISHYHGSLTNFEDLCDKCSKEEIEAAAIRYFGR